MIFIIKKFYNSLHDNNADIKEHDDIVLKDILTSIIKINIKEIYIMCDFNYYSFVLNGEERIYYTYISNDNELEILEWAERFGFLKEDDFSKCTNIRQISREEVNRRNKELYKEWWDKRELKRLSGEDVSPILMPPTIGEVQLN